MKKLLVSVNANNNGNALNNHQGHFVVHIPEISRTDQQ